MNNKQPAAEESCDGPDAPALKGAPAIMGTNGNTALAERPSLDAKAIEAVLLGGDLSKLTTEQRVSYYNRVCESLGLNPLTQPFAYLTLNGKQVLYAKRDATEQLRKIHNISIEITSREVIEGCYIVTARAAMPSQRCDESTGAVPIDGLKGEARANALMKAETKAKRRVTLSICGLGILDETEVESIPDARPAMTVMSEPTGYAPWLAHLKGVADKGEAALKAAWEVSAYEFRRYLTETDNATWTSLKSKAAQAAAVTEAA